MNNANPAINNTEEDEQQDLAFKIINLEDFRIEYKDYTVYEQINDATVLALVDSQYFKHNRELKLSFSESISNSLFKSLSHNENSKYIQILILNDLYIDDKAINGISKGKNLFLEELEINNVDGIKGQGLINYFQSSNVKRLRKISFKNLSIGNDVILNMITNMKKMKLLNDIKISDCSNINTDSIENFFLDPSTKIKNFYLEKIEVLDRAFRKWASCNSLFYLQSLTLKTILGVKEIGLLDFFKSKNLKRLKYLHLENLEEITKGVFENIAKMPSKLEEIKYSDFSYLNVIK